MKKDSVQTKMKANPGPIRSFLLRIWTRNMCNIGQLVAGGKHSPFLSSLPWPIKITTSTLQKCWRASVHPSSSLPCFPKGWIDRQSVGESGNRTECGRLSLFFKLWIQSCAAVWTICSRQMFVSEITCCPSPLKSLPAQQVYGRLAGELILFAQGSPKF